MRLKGKVSLITGGGRGIGRAIAMRFAQEGSPVVVSGSTEAPLIAVAREIAEGGGRAMPVVADVADEAAVEKLFSKTLDKFGRVDVLVNNAGIAGPTAPVVDLKKQDWDRVLAVNLTGAYLCSRLALPGMIDRNSGRIINIASVAGFIAYALRSPYAVSKWGMIGLTRTLALEVGRYNITVNAIAPGATRGERIERVIRSRAAELGQPVEEVEKGFVENTALRRMVDESDIAEMALFLASDDGRNITGETLTVAAGFHL